MGANELIKNYTIESNSTEPLEMALHLMRHPKVKMHGPEHHFLVPAVLISAYYNYKSSSPQYTDNHEPGNGSLPGDSEKEQLLTEKKKMILKAEGRAKNVLGGFCGFYGNCGAAVGTGIFISVITGAKPVSKEVWMLANLMTAQSLQTIALHGGPRCCKRNTYLAITEAVSFLKEHLGVELGLNRNITCEFYDNNRECLADECDYYPADLR
jgi:hypothetical protein